MITSSSLPLSDRLLTLVLPRAKPVGPAAIGAASEAWT